MLTQQEYQFLADWLRGIQPEHMPLSDNLSEIAAVAWSVIDGYEQPRPDDPADADEIRQDLYQVITLRFGDRGRLWLSELFGPRRHFPALAEIADGLQPVSWLWPDWLPAGMISLLAARPGTGKSLVALDIARRVIHGDPWPDDQPAGPPAPVVYVEGENVPQILNERATRWGMDTGRLYLMLPDPGDCLIDLSSTQYQDKLAWMVHTVRPALLVIDSLGSVMGSGENAVEDVRELMAYLSSLAAAYGLGLLLIHHLRKGSGNQMALMDGIDIDMIRGSGHLAAMSRVAWGLSTIQTGPEPDRNGPRRLEVIKTNLGRYPDPLGLVLQQLEPNGVRLDWSITAPKRYQEPTAGDGCGEWLIDLLAASDEPMRPKDVIELGAKAGFSRRMIYRCREELGDQIVNSRGRRNPTNGWALAGDDHILDE
jgi:hypothetical protein